MGWSSGSELAGNVWDLFRDFVPKKKRKKVAQELMGLFEDHDCDTLQEAETLYSDAGKPYRDEEE